MPIARRPAIHPTVIVVSARPRAAKATFTGSPLVRVCSTLNLRAMTGGWLGALYLSISRSDPVTTLNLRTMSGEWLRPLYISISRTDPLSQIDRPSRAKKVTDPEINKKFDFDIFEEEGRVFRYLNGDGNAMRFS